SITSLCEMVCQVVQKKLEEKQLEEEESAKAKYWKLPICYDDDDDEERSDSLDDNIISGLPSFSAITPGEPVLSTEDPNNSLSMRDEHLDTIPATESDEVIKSSVENLIPIPSESEGIPEHKCDVPSLDNSSPLDASPPDSELVSSEVMEIVIPETNTFDNSLHEFETFCLDVEGISSGSTTTPPDISLPEYEAFYDDHVKEISIAPYYLLSLRNEDAIFDPGIFTSTFFRPDISHQCGTVKKFNTHRSHLNGCPI
nr:hypothetical protein [Tanacetum cinerariifolium]